MDKDIPQLTAGVCDQIASTGPQDLAQFTSPIVQILQPKVIELNGKKRWRILISDGTHALPVMVATQLNALFEDGHAGDGSIVRVQRLIANAITGRRIVIILDLEVLVKEAEKIGNPTPRTTTTTDEDIPQLTAGFCNQLVSSASTQDPVLVTSPIVQIVQAKAIETNSDQKLWRTVISDGVHVLQAMVVFQLNTLFENGDAGKGSIVRIQRFTINTIQDRRIPIILDLEVLVKDAEKIGTLTPLTIPPADENVPQLTTGFCDQLLSPADVQDHVWATSPTVQIVQAKVIETNGQKRWRVAISDGVHVIQAMVVFQFNALFENGDAGTGSIVRIRRSVVNMIQGRRIPIILDLEVLVKDAEKIGTPTPLTTPPADGGIPQLTTGFCNQLVSSADAQDQDHVWTTSPIAQIVQANAIETNGQKRWRVVISDGVHVLQAMVVLQFNALFDNGNAGKGSIIRIQRFVINTIQGRRIMIILGLEILVKETGRIGNPIPCTFGPEGTTPMSPSTAEPSGLRTAPHKPSRPTLPIGALNPYSNNWTIKARVTQKSEIRTWSNQRSEGKLFSFALVDESGEMRGVGFNAAVDQFHDKLEVGKVYYFSKAKVNAAKKNFTNVASEYELTLEKNTEIEECTDQSGVPEIKDGFVKLDDLVNEPVGSTCDVIAIVGEVGQVSTILTKDKRTTAKRELTLVDRSNSSVRLTLWGKQAEAYEDDGSHPIIAFKGVRINEFQGRTLSMVGGSTMTVNPSIPSAYVLRGWYDSVGVDQSFAANSGAGSGLGGAVTFNRAEVRTIEDIKANLQIAEKAEMFSCRGSILHVEGDNPAYPACPNQSCKKKVVNTVDGWHCEKCGKTWEEPEYRYIISMTASDHTGRAWLQGFHDVGLAVFNMSADDLMQIKNDDDAKYKAILSKTRYSTFNFACRAKRDTYQGQSRVRYGISKILPLNYKEETGYLRDILKNNWAN